MKITLSDKNGVVLQTANKYCEEDIEVNVQTEELTITPSTETQVNEGLYNKVTVNAINAKITNAKYLFYEGMRLDSMNELLGLCENVSNTYSMFGMCRDLTKIDLSNFNASNATNMVQMFYDCRKLTELNLSGFDTSNAETMQSMFNECRVLTDLDLSSFDMSKVVNVRSMFNNTVELTNLKSFKNLGKGYTEKTNNYSYYKLDLSDCTKLTHESLMDIINNLYDLNLTYGGSAYKQDLYIGSTNLAKLTADEIAIATNKGWDVT